MIPLQWYKQQKRQKDGIVDIPEQLISDTKHKVIEYLKPEIVNKVNYESIMYGVIYMIGNDVSLNKIKSLILGYDGALKRKNEKITQEREIRKSYQIDLQEKQQKLAKLKKQNFLELQQQQEYEVYNLKIILAVKNMI